MEINKLDDMIKGWFIGNFEPSMHRTNDVEVGIKNYEAGDHEAAHFHKIATEFTAIVSGRVRMNGREYGAGDIVKILPFEATDFTALEKTTTVVVKIPGANDDKYVC